MAGEEGKVMWLPEPALFGGRAGGGMQEAAVQPGASPKPLARVWYLSLGPDSARHATQIICGMCWDGYHLRRALSRGLGGFVGRGRLVSVGAELRCV